MSSALVLTATQRALPFTRMKDMHVLIHSYGILIHPSFSLQLDAMTFMTPSPACGKFFYT